jgi:hypothetical protein
LGTWNQTNEEKGKKKMSRVLTSGDKYWPWHYLNIIQKGEY